jgi:oligosaccharyltransferase complex subunit gamma
MKVLSFLAASLFSIGAIAAKKDTKDTDRFFDYQSKQLSSAPIKLTDTTYSKLTAAPRNYSAAILLTALDTRFGCQLCREFHPEWDVLAKSWTKGDKAGESRLVFGTLDFLDGKNTFQSVRSPDNNSKM